MGCVVSKNNKVITVDINKNEKNMKYENNEENDEDKVKSNIKKEFIKEYRKQNNN